MSFKRIFKTALVRNRVGQEVSGYFLTFWRRNYFFLILAHSI